MGMEYKANSVIRRPGIAAREEAQKALCAGIHPHGVPIAVQDEHGIRLQLQGSSNLWFRHWSGVSILDGRIPDLMTLSIISGDQTHYDSWTLENRCP